MKRTAKREPIAVPALLKPIATAMKGTPGVTIEPGWGSSSVVLKARGKIFVMLLRDELVLKLPKERVDEIVAARGGRRFDPRRDGRVMKEWVVLSGKGGKPVELAREAHRFVGGKSR